MRTRLFLYVLGVLSALSPVFAAPLSGTHSIGPTGEYASLTAAIADVNAEGNGLGGALVLELQAGYVSTVETFPLTIPALTGASATNTLTIRPASGATSLSITSADTTAATIDLNGAQYVTFDGRPGGTGTAKELTIENTNTAGVALRFINEASNNTIKFITLKSVNTAFGTVYFGTTTGANGNDNNTIDHCDIRDGATTPSTGILSYSIVTTTAQANSGNTVTNCNIFNFYNSAFSAGVNLATGSTDWTISGNSFYQTASRAAVASPVVPIFIGDTSGNNFNVSGNFIGGSAPGCGGTAWTTTGTAAAYLFQGIRLSVGGTTPSSVQGNTIANIVWTSSSNATTLPGVWSGIYVSSGSVNIGTVTGNTIGSGTGTGFISVTTSGNGGTTFGIGAASSGGVNIANNTIGSITTNASVSTISASLVGIQVTAGANTISNNTVGSTTTANSLNAATASTSTNGQQVAGIFSSSSGASITGNTVANLNNNHTGNATNGLIRGIVTTFGVNTITGNTVRNLSTTSQNANTSTSQSVQGIAQTSAAAGQTISRNTVHSLANTAASANVSVSGIYFAGPTSGTNLIARNFVHSLAVSSSSASSVLYGMYFANGTFTAQNNLVRLGLDANGTSTAGASIIRGIYEAGGTAGRNIYHNSVYLGGTHTSSSTTYAFQSLTTTSTRDFRNNVFVNACSGAGKHCAVYYNSNGALAGLTASNNLFLASGTGGVLGLYNGDVLTLTAWQTATGRDANSLNADPLFLNPTGDSSTVNLHLQAASPAFNTGLALAAVTDDIDGNTRNATTPTVGADEFFGSNIIVTQTSTVADGGSIDFGPVTLGSSPMKTFTLTNLGNLDLTTLAITKDGTNPSDFTISAFSGTTVPVGSGSVTFTVTFTPSASGARSAAIHITSNVLGTKNPYDIVLNGAGEAGLAPEIIVHNGSHNLAAEISHSQVMVVNFGSTAQNVASTRNILVSNAGDAPLDITSITLPSGYLTNGAATTLAPGASYGFQVALKSSTPGIYAGSIVINNNDIDEPAFDFPVTGSVVAPGSAPVVNIGNEVSGPDGTGSSILGGPAGSTLFNLTGSPSINSSGVLASAVQIRHADASLHTGIMAGQPMTLIVTDTMDAPSLPGVTHFNFGPPVINETGHIVFTGEVRGPGITTNVNSRCLFSNASDGTLKLVARVGTSVGLGSNLKTIGNFSIGGDLVIFLGTLVDNRIVLFGWDANTGLRPLMRNGQSLDANGITKTVKSFNVLETSNASSGHGKELSVAPTGESLVTINVTFTDNSSGVVVGSFDGTSDTGFGATYGASQQLADTYAAPAVIPLAKWSTFRSPGFDNTGKYYGFISQMVTNTLAGVTSTNNVGVFVDTAPGNLTLQLRENDVATDTGGLVFSDFSDLVLGGGDYEFLVKGEVRGSGVVTNVNDKGLWAQHATNGLVLVAREGSEAPGVVGSTFFRLTQIALPGTAQPMFQASMTAGVGGVTAANDTGLWVINEAGAVKLAVREGDVINVAGTDRNVTAITALLNGTTTGGALGRRVFLEDGQLTLLLTFSGGVQANAKVVVP